MAGDETYYHGIDVDTALDLLSSAPLDGSKAATRKIDGPPGFFLSKHMADAEFFALRRGRGTVLKIELSAAAMNELSIAGAVRRPIPRSSKSPKFHGDELFVPFSAFDLFNRLRSLDEIRFEPMA